MPVEIQAAIDAAFKRAVDDEIHAAKAGKKISFHPVSAAMREQVMHLLFRHMFHEQRVERRFIGEQTDAEAIAFIPGPGMGDVDKR